MNFLELLLGPVTKILERIIPDPQARAQAQLELFKAQQAGDFKELDAQLQRDLAQIAVNNTEAASPSLFKSGWRPAVGWICACALGYEFIGRVLAGWVLGNWMHWTQPPTLDMGDLMTLLGGLLGLGTLRTAEKLKGVA
jgi:hypothetical protein